VNRREGLPIINPHPIRQLCLKVGENIRGILGSVALPSINGSVFFKRWYLGITCFVGSPRPGSHSHSAVAVIGTVSNALLVERAATVAAAV